MKSIFYYSVVGGNRGDIAIRKSIVEAIQERIDVPFTFFNIKYEKLTQQRILKQLNTDASCLIIAGSGLYTNYSTASGWYFPCYTELFSQIKVPIILLGLGCNNNLGNDIFNGDLTPDAQRSIKHINDLSVISTVRDERTFQLLQTLGVEKHQLMLDPANFLRVQRIPRKKRVAINIAQHSPSLGRYDGDDTNRRKNIECFVDVVSHLEMLGYEAVFIAHDGLENSLIVDLQEELPRLKWVNTDDIDVMLREYAACQFSIGVKMHSNILSFAAGTPFISLYYDVKSIEYLKLINWSAFGYSVFDDYYQWVLSRIDDLIKHWRVYSQRLQDIKVQKQVEFETLMDKVCDIIETSH